MFKFWYRFVPDAVGAIELGKGDVYYQNIVKNRISEYMGDVFEDMARYFSKSGFSDWVVEHAAQDRVKLVNIQDMYCI
ncbi:MAG: DUF234 domain-containing protein [Lachnospiraceae bacterium]|nr:DUF234 domain-containing protein [Lachnospiraceae bacterium]